MHKQSADESGTNVFTPPAKGVGLVEPSRSYASRPPFESLAQPGCQSTEVFLCACVCRARAKIAGGKKKTHRIPFFVSKLGNIIYLDNKITKYLK
jgi:hypothetical protein